MIVSVTFDTKTKSLDTLIDGKKMDNVSEVQFFGFDNDKGSVSIRQFEEIEDDKAFKITNIMASEDGEYKVVSTRTAAEKLAEILESDTSNGTVSVVWGPDDDNLTEEDFSTLDISRRLFPRKKI